MVQVHHDEEVANRIDPESCAVACEGYGEALTGDCTGQPLSRESTLIPCRRRSGDGRQHGCARYRERPDLLSRVDHRSTRDVRMRGCPSHHGCTDQACDVKILLANSEPSTHGPALHSVRSSDMSGAEVIAEVVQTQRVCSD